MGIPEFQGERVIPGEPMVRVELVAALDAKDDCRNYTKTVWVGQGDVQPYPKRLWPKLAAHPDVWRLVDGETAVAPLPLVAVQAPAWPGGLRTDGPTKAQYVAAGYKAESYPPHGYAVREEPGDKVNDPTINGLPLLTEDELAAMSDDEVRAASSLRKLGLHPNLGSAKIRDTVLALQAEKRD